MPPVNSDELHPASMRPSTATATSPPCKVFPACGGGIRVPASRAAQSYFPAMSSAFGDFDLLRPQRLDARPVALLDPPAHADAAVLEPFRIEPCNRKIALVSFRDRHCKCL